MNIVIYKALKWALILLLGVGAANEGIKAKNNRKKRNAQSVESVRPVTPLDVTGLTDTKKGSVSK